MELNMVQKQVQTLSPQMMQSMEILQMGSQELLEYIENAVQENPVLEQGEVRDQVEEFAQLKRKLEWLESGDHQNRCYHQEDDDAEQDPLGRYGTVDDRQETLCGELVLQLEERNLPPALSWAAKFLAENLNRNGWLDESLADLAVSLGCSQTLMEQALAQVQNLEPAGVGARGLNECLCLQLLRQKPVNELAVQIARGYLESLAKSHYGLIARELNTSLEAVREACDLIRSLNPRPGAGFASGDTASYINPDLIVVTYPDRFEILTNDYFFPTLQISGYYTRLMREAQNDQQLQEYLTGKVRQAKWVVRAVEQRRSTLLSCAECILEVQDEFFRKGAGHLAPMTLADVAERLNVHESTVSRAVKDKYLQCDKGVYPLGWFFSRSLGPVGEPGGRATPDAAKALLKKMIAEEDKRKPLSDQKLCELMSQAGCELSRRTVAKYRDELNIPSTTGRKQYP